MLLRRRFFGALAVGLGATATPVWLSRSFGLHGDTCEADPAAAPTDPSPIDCDPTGVARKPQLVLVIPADHQPTQRSRGQAFGEILNHGDDEQRGLFAMFDVVCRRVDQLPVDVQSAVRGEPLMIVLDPAAAIPVLPLAADLPPLPEPRDDLDWDAFTIEEERVIRERMELLTDLLHLAVARTDLAERAARERASLSCREARILDDLPDSLDSLTPTLVDRAPAITMLAVRGADEDTRARLRALLAAAARIRLTDRPIDGAPWARGGGCGVMVEGAADNHGMACGMGHVPEKSVRFLKFYASRW